MKIAALQKAKPPEMKRTAIYLSSTLHQDLVNFAEDNGVSVNRATVYLVERGLQAVDDEIG